MFVPVQVAETLSTAISLSSVSFKSNVPDAKTFPVLVPASLKNANAAPLTSAKDVKIDIALKIIFLFIFIHAPFSP